jgi:hypothetical protein
MSDKLNIQNEMAVFDRKDRTFYDTLTDEERKKFSTFLMLRWGSSINGSRELQEYYVQSTNHYLNKHFFAVNTTAHKKLQWLMATAVSPDMGTPRHVWIAPKKKEAGVSAKRKGLQEIYPGYKDDEIDVMMQLTTQKEIDAYNKSAGQDKK